MQRRPFMQRLAAFGAVGALTGLSGGRARANPDAAPLRLVLWYQPNGYGQDPAAVHARSLELLDPHRDEIVYLRGMHNETADGTHEAPMESMLRGGFEGPSFDQQIAAALDRPSLSSLALGIRSEAGGFGGQCSFLSDGSPTPRIERPEDTWAAVFAGLDVGEDPQAQAQAEALWARRDLIMTKNQQLAESMRSRLAATQRERLDQYIASIDEIRDEMTSLADTNDACTIPAEPPASPPGDWNDFSNYGPIADGQISMLVHALQCELTRVGLLQFHRATSQIHFDQVDGQPYQDHHHALSHLPGDGSAEADLQQVLDWYDGRLLALVDALASRTDVDGSPLLANTVIVRITECMLSNGHEFAEGHHLLLGGSNHLATGVDQVVSNDDPLTKLWATLAQAMGVDLPSVAGYQGDVYDQLLA